MDKEAALEADQYDELCCWMLKPGLQMLKETQLHLRAFPHNFSLVKMFQAVFIRHYIPDGLDILKMIRC